MLWLAPTGTATLGKGIAILQEQRISGTLEKRCPPAGIGKSGVTDRPCEQLALCFDQNSKRVQNDKDSHWRSQRPTSFIDLLLTFWIADRKALVDEAVLIASLDPPANKPLVERTVLRTRGNTVRRRPLPSTNGFEMAP